MYRIKYSKKAVYRIYDIFYYIESELCNPNASRRFIINIYLKVLNLKYFPYLGKKYLYNQRYLIYKNFLIVYEINEKEKLVFIKTIVHRMQNRT